MTRTDQVVETWGGATVLPSSAQVHAPQSLIPLLREGIPFEALENLLRIFALSRDEIMRILALPPRTLARRRQQQRLSSAESDRLFRLTRILVHAAEVLGDRDKVVIWLRRPNRALDGATPLSLLDTDIGATEVDHVLGRIEHGVFS
jgi:putative toxin-antitoxin system antitoxin component (TIGR02293 family)